VRPPARTWYSPLRFTGIIKDRQKEEGEKPMANPVGYTNALIVGAGSGLSASLARRFAQEGLRVALAARNIEKLAPLLEETGARAFACDATDPQAVAALFTSLEQAGFRPDLVVYNAGQRLRGRIEELDPAAVAAVLASCAYGGFLVAQQAARRMLPARFGAIALTGASASLKGYPQSAPFAMGKFALRGLAQSLARELSPQGIHVLHVVIDGAIRNPGRVEPADAPDSMLDPEAIAATYWHILCQPRSAWSWEIELRPWVERF
jgi:NAD(P)-dependent dehydrogenase (short-subunit alcohol dehydrogenase family)